MSPSEPMIRLAGVSKTYDAITALHPVDLDVARGEFLTLLGPSGSGKTTLLNLIAGMITPSRGSIAIAGRDVTTIAPNKRNLGMVFQNYALLPHLTIFENVAYPLRIRRNSEAEIRAKVARVLELMQLGHVTQRLPRELSGGQQQRVSLARCIVYDPALILMDEPLGALDKKLREQMQLEIKRLHLQLGTTILYVTHDQEEALSMSDRIVLLNHGRIVQSATPAELYFRPGSMFAATFLGASNILDVREVITTGGRTEAVLAAGPRVQVGDRLPVPAARGVKAVVRPESMLLLTTGDSHALPNELPGTLTLSAILGGVTHHHVGLADGGSAMVQELTRAGRPMPQPGAAVRLAWAAADTFLLPADAEMTNAH
jgi:putative spermidine/putrescine transport system ATP-binding protein